MSAPSTADPRFSHRQVQVEGLSIHVAEAGTRGRPAVVAPGVAADHSLAL
jgi:hypothetical protein